MRFGKLFRYDLRSGFTSWIFRLAAIIVLVLVSCAEMYFRKHTVYRLADAVPPAGYMDYLCYLLGGIREYMPGGEENFLFPAKWFLFHLLVQYGCLHYSVRDLSSLGSTVLPRSGNRTAWWLSKCLWNCCYVTAVYALTAGAVLLFCMAAGEPVNLQVTPEFLNTLMGAGCFYESIPAEFSLVIVGLPFFISLGNCLIQLVLTLFLKPMFSFGIAAAFLLCGAYRNLPVFWETFAMPVRSAYVVENGFAAAEGAVIALAAAVLAAVIGTVCFKRKNILRMEG